MAFDPVTDAQLEAGKPADEDLMTALASRDEWNKSEADNGGSGIAPNLDDFAAAYTTGHTHDGTDGQGEPIGAAGIATNGINDSDMFAAGAVTHAKLSTSGASRMQGSNFDDGAVTLPKLSGGMVNSATPPHFEGSKAEVDGTTEVITHGLGRIPVVTNIQEPTFCITSRTSTTITIAENPAAPADPWAWSFDLW